jgi:hypothetical protein
LVKAVRKLWQDNTYYTKLSAAALAYAQRPGMNFTDRIHAHEQALAAAAMKKAVG